MSTLLKKIIFSSLAGLVFLFSLAPYLEVAAQDQTPQVTPAPTGTWYNSSFGDWFNKVYNSNESPDNEIFGERYTAAQVQWVIYGIWAFIFNIVVPENVTKCLLTNTTDLNACNDELQGLLNKTTPVTGYAVPSSQNKSLLAAVFADRSFSGVSYVRHQISKFSLVPTAHAQSRGFGFSALDPVQSMWGVFRNIAFGLFVVTAIAFAFMIMFRVKISPQVVISIQSAIPKLIFALVLVTFSYAIAGFLIDIMYVLFGLLSALLAPLIPTVLIIQPTKYTPTDLFNLLTLGQTAGSSVGGGIFHLVILYLSPTMAILLILALFGAVLAIPTGGFGLVVAAFFFILLLIAIIVGLWIAIKTIWALFKAFANIILLTIFAPLQLALGPLITNFGFGQWLRSYLSNLSVFLVTAVLWLLAWVFGLQAWRVLASSGSLLLKPTPTSDVWPPLLGTSEFGSTLLFVGVSFVMFTLIPKSTEIVQGFISGKPFAYGTAIGETFGPVKALGLFGAAEGMNRYETIQRGATRGPYTTPATIQAARRLLGLKSS